MSFWKSTKIKKARKQHVCALCGNVININDSYYRETGTCDNDFNDYCLCERCSFLLDYYHDEGDIGDLDCILFKNDMITCDNCSSINITDKKYSPDKMLMTCKCKDCGTTFTTDLSIDGLKEIISRY